jgi:hypothetical protein
MNDVRRVRAASLALFGLGLALFLSPWLLGFSNSRTAFLSACGIGSLAALIAAASAFRVRDWWAAGALSLGAWAATAPIVFGFLDRPSATLTHVGAGLAAMILAVLAEDWRVRRPPLRPAGG